MKFSIEYDSYDGMLYRKYQNDLTRQIEVMDELDLMRFQFRRGFQKIANMATVPPFWMAEVKFCLDFPVQIKRWLTACC